MKQDARNRFMAMVSKDCWAWTGSPSARYGRFWNGFDKQAAHRYAYELFVGPITPGMEVCHKCDNPKCVNPDHLFLGTSLDNQRDKSAKQRAACGTSNGHSKLTETDVIAIRSRYASGGITTYQLAAEYKVTRPAIGYIINRKVWKHVS